MTAIGTFLHCAPVAQMDRVHASGAWGREFESHRARHFQPVTGRSTAACPNCESRALDNSRNWHMLKHMPLKRKHKNREQHVKLFRNGRNQAVRIPREFELPGNDAIIRREGERLIIERTPPKSLLAVLDKLNPIDEKFPPVPELATEPIDL